jgi:hypothetical protein
MDKDFTRPFDARGDAGYDEPNDGTWRITVKIPDDHVELEPSE